MYQQQKRATPFGVLRYGLVLVVLLWTTFPIAWMIITSFKPADDVMRMPPEC